MIHTSRSSMQTGRPVDQAHGLRQMFPTRVLRFVPVVSNPQVIFGGVVLERLCAAYAGFGLKTLVVDAGERARPPSELAGFDLSEGIEALSADVSYLPARGLPLKHVDAQGSSASLVDALATAAPQIDVVILHASASELVRMLSKLARGQNLRPLVFTDENPAGLTHAYAAVKVMAQRAQWMAYDLLVCANPASQMGAQIAHRLEQCADNFLGAAQRDWLQINPMEPATQDPGPAFLDMAADLLRCALPHTLGESAFDHLMSPGAALPSRSTPVFN
ncbi:MAG TPA: flagellar biosynthesis protein [Aquabacterium sp.]|uniref:flagellar biosynthesis protein n=1 Tax=Aquabacterium sp. TaxID=1872578 RepID=UPI002E360A55|nr:flagellar biosynthesis protein [Aquabacterium sp.]HEX5371203.1 flagellar biosynthesis protein [Aquabacterium sp.]